MLVLWSIDPYVTPFACAEPTPLFPTSPEDIPSISTFMSPTGSNTGLAADNYRGYCTHLPDTPEKGARRDKKHTRNHRRPRDRNGQALADRRAPPSPAHVASRMFRMGSSVSRGYSMERKGVTYFELWNNSSVSLAIDGIRRVRRSWLTAVDNNRIPTQYTLQTEEGKTTIGNFLP